MRRIRAWFDSSLSRRGALAGWAVAGILALVGAGTLLLAAVGAATGGDPEVADLPTPAQVFLTSLSRSLGIAAPATLLAGLLNLWFWFIGLLVMGTIFAWRTNALNRTTARIMAGRAPLTVHGHVVILGWSPIVPVLVRELALSTERAVRRTVVVLSGRDRRDALTELTDLLEAADLEGRLRIVTRAGDPWSPADLRRVNCGVARTVIIVDDAARSEYAAMTLAFAVAKQRQDDTQRCIVQVRNAAMKAIVDGAEDPRLIAITSEDIIAKALAQSARQPGVTQALFELLDFGGLELYSQEVDRAAGLPYGDVARRLVGGTTIGLVRAEGGVLVNPDPATVVGAGDRCLVVKADADHLAVLGGDHDVAPPTVAAVRLVTAGEPHVAIVGPAEGALRVAGNLTSFLSAGAEVTILSRDEVTPPPATAGGATVHVRRVEDYFGGLAAALADVPLDQLVVLADRTLAASAAEVDATTAVIMATARQRLTAQGRDVRFVTQVLDPRAQGLIPAGTADDLIISEEASAMMIVQAAADPVVFRVLVDLLDPSVGAAIHVLALPERSAGGEPLRFGDLVELGLASRASVIGWRHLDPDKGWRVELGVPRDTLVPDLPGFGVLAITESVARPAPTPVG